jgi:hypothetical protein
MNRNCIAGLAERVARTTSDRFRPEERGLRVDGFGANSRSAITSFIFLRRAPVIGHTSGNNRSGGTVCPGSRSTTSSRTSTVRARN